MSSEGEVTSEATQRVKVGKCRNAEGGTFCFRLVFLSRGKQDALIFVIIVVPAPDLTRFWTLSPRAYSLMSVCVQRETRGFPQPSTSCTALTTQLEGCVFFLQMSSCFTTFYAFNLSTNQSAASEASDLYASCDCLYYSRRLASLLPAPCCCFLVSLLRFSCATLRRIDSSPCWP